ASTRADSRWAWYLRHDRISNAMPRTMPRTKAMKTTPHTAIFDLYADSNSASILWRSCNAFAARRDAGSRAFAAENMLAILLPTLRLGGDGAGTEASGVDMFCGRYMMTYVRYSPTTPTATILDFISAKTSRTPQRKASPTFVSALV
ncbi:unnamed protein product, partial [Ectocarpus fasciculatus]